MPTAHPLVAFFKDIDKHDIPLVGGKGANLGEMTQAEFPVPYGFAVTVVSYDRFLDDSGLRDEINAILAQLDVDNSDELNRATKHIERRILNADFPEDVAKEVLVAYRKLSGMLSKATVAVRSSATAEDLPGASFAGQQATFLDVKGDKDLLQKIKECWASLFTARAIFYRVQNKIKHDRVKICVIVQKMVQSEVSGVMFSMNPVTNEKDRIVIESVWGLGEMIVQGSVLPDKYVVQKETFAILSKEVSDQSKQLVRSKTGTEEKPVPMGWRDKQKITDKEIVALAKLADRLQAHYYFPQDIEWAKQNGKLYITQTRPITTMAAVKKASSQTVGEMEVAAPILHGTSASPGVGTGRVKILKSPKEIGKIHEGDILVAEMTSPDYVPAMKKAAAIITDAGGSTSHAAIVSRELGVPCVVGTRDATHKLKDDVVVTVDGTKGLVYLGGKLPAGSEPLVKKVLKKKKRKIKTATKIYVNLAEPERAREIAKKHVDGVGLLRAEFMIANIGIHPKEAIKQKTQDKFIKKLAHDLETFCAAFYPRPVTYRATDFKTNETNEYRALPGGKVWEPIEPNPLLGFRGAFRYVANPEVFNLELQAIKLVREKYKNLNLMIPFCRSPEELARVRRLVSASGLFESTTFKFLMMCELPVNVILLEEFIKVGIDGVSIGSNDLTMLLLGTDRDNSEVAQAFNERSEAVDWALKRVIKTCNKYGITSSICGQAPSTYEDLVEKLVKWGVTGISVNPDAVERVREVVSKTEKEVIS